MTELGVSPVSRSLRLFPLLLVASHSFYFQSTRHLFRVNYLTLLRDREKMRTMTSRFGRRRRQPQVAVVPSFAESVRFIYLRRIERIIAVCVTARILSDPDPPDPSARHRRVIPRNAYLRLAISRTTASPLVTGFQGG